MLLELGRFAATFALLALLGVSQGCLSPLGPGCGPNREKWPDGETHLLTLYLGSATNGIRRGSGVSLDASGRSGFIGEYTVWLLSSRVVCRQVSARDVERIRAAWERALRSGAPTGGRREEPRPYLAVSFSPGDELADLEDGSASFIVRPATLEKGSDLDAAVAITLGVFIDLYGDRLVREIHYAGLDPLVPDGDG